MRKGTSWAWHASVVGMGMGTSWGMTCERPQDSAATPCDTGWPQLGKRWAGSGSYKSVAAAAEVGRIREAPN